MPERTLDWIPNFDERSVPFRLALLDCYSVGLYKRSIMRTKTIFLNQGQEGACTGFGAEHVRALSPRRKIVSDASAFRIYTEAKKQDEWPGEDYDGSSVNGAMKAERLAGNIKSWRWAYSMDEVKHGLSYHGACELGTWWYSNMWDTDSSGFVHATGTKVGGHAIAVAGYKHLNGGVAYRLENSWGKDWGDNGGAWVWESDLMALLGDDGEIAFPVKAG